MSSRVESSATWTRRGAGARKARTTVIAMTGYSSAGIQDRSATTSVGHAIAAHLCTENDEGASRRLRDYTDAATSTAALGQRVRFAFLADVEALRAFRCSGGGLRGL